MNIKDNAIKEPRYSDDFMYDLMTGGYINPDNILVSDTDVKRVQEAMIAIEEFLQSAEQAGAIVEC